MNNTLELHPFPVAGFLMLSALGLQNPYVFRFENGDRWCVRAGGMDWWIIELPDGALQLVEMAL